MVVFDHLIRVSELPRHETVALIRQVTGHSREWLIAHGDESPADDQLVQIQSLIEQRAAGQPLAYILGHREFYGREFFVSPSVLIPRPETEQLVQWVIQQAADGAQVLEMGTGSGAIAVSVACARPDLALIATDISADALSVAQHNAARLKAPPIEFRQGDWYNALGPQSTETFDIIVCNPPYIGTEDPHLNAGDLRFEPANALSSGPSGLNAIEAIAAGASTRLKPGAWLAVEHGFDQAKAVREAFSRHGLEQAQSDQDLSGHWRITRACRFR